MRDCGTGRAAQVLRNICISEDQSKLGPRWLELKSPTESESWPDRVCCAHSRVTQTVAFLCLIAIRTRSNCWQAFHRGLCGMFTISIVGLFNVFRKLGIRSTLLLDLSELLTKALPRRRTSHTRFTLPIARSLIAERAAVIKGPLKEVRVPPRTQPRLFSVGIMAAKTSTVCGSVVFICKYETTRRGQA